MKLKESQFVTNAGLIRDTARIRHSGATVIRRQEKRTVEAVVIGHVETDRTQLIVWLDGAGDTPAAAIAALADTRDAVIAGLGVADVGTTDFNPVEQSTEAPSERAKRLGLPRDAPRLHGARLRASITIKRKADPLELITQPGLDRITSLENVFYWLSNPDAKLAPIENAALDGARKRAETLYGSRVGALDDVTFTSNLRDRTDKFKPGRLRISMTAKARFFIQPAEGEDAVEPVEVRGVTHSVVGDPPNTRRDLPNDSRTFAPVPGALQQAPSD